MAKMPPAFLKKIADSKSGMKGKAPAAKLCPGCKKPACMKMGKCMKGA